MYPLAASPKWVGEGAIGWVWTRLFPNGARLVLMDDLRTTRDGANPNPRTNVRKVRLPGRRTLYAGRSLVLLFPGNYLSDSREQEDAQAKSAGFPLVNDRHTLDHRREVPDTTVSVLHWSRHYRASHQWHALSRMRRWPGVYGWKGGLTAAVKLQGLSGYLPPYGKQPIHLQAVAELMHFSKLGLAQRSNTVHLEAVQAHEPEQVLPRAPKRDQHGAVGARRARAWTRRGAACATPRRGWTAQAPFATCCGRPCATWARGRAGRWRVCTTRCTR